MFNNPRMRPRGRGRGRAKFLPRSNLHVIATHVPAVRASTPNIKPSPKALVKKEANPVPVNTKSPVKGCTPSQDAKSSIVVNNNKPTTSDTKSVEEMKDVLPKKTDSSSTSSPSLPKSNTSREVKTSFAQSNFLALQKADKSIPKKNEDAKKLSRAQSSFLLLSSKIDKVKTPNKPAPKEKSLGLSSSTVQNVDKSVTQNKPVSEEKSDAPPKSLQQNVVKIVTQNKPFPTEKSQAPQSSPQKNVDKIVIQNKPVPKEQSCAPSNLPQQNINKIVSPNKPVTKEKSSAQSSSLPLQNVDKISTQSKPVPKGKNHAQSNFLALQNVDKVVSKTLLSKKVASSQAVRTASKKLPAQNNAGKPLQKVLTQLKNSPHDQKKPCQTKKFVDDQKPNMSKQDSNLMSEYKRGKSTGKKGPFSSKEYFATGKKSSYYEEEFLNWEREGKKKTRKDAPGTFDSSVREPYWEGRSGSERSCFSSDKEEISPRKRLRSSRDYIPRSIEEEMYYKHKYKRSREKGKGYERRERVPYAHDSYTWYSKDYKSKHKYPEERYVSHEYSDYPHEGDFEEVEDFEEVASVDSKVRVRFRKCLVRYLPYRISSYFRPKWYYISRKRYAVNCMYAAGKENILESDEHITIDENLKSERKGRDCKKVDDGVKQKAVSDKETMEKNITESNNAVDRKKIKAKEVTPVKLNKDTKDCDVTGKLSDVKVSSSKVNAETELMLKKETLEESCLIPVIDFCSSSPLKSEKSFSDLSENNQVDCNVDQIIKLEEEDVLPETFETTSEHSNEISLVCEDSKLDSQLASKVFLKCDSKLEYTDDFFHGESVIQELLAEWKSHLIGLEYMVEIRNNVDDTIVKNYHCELCNDEIPVDETSGQNVINHIISSKHMSNYMAKHFPSSDYKFSKSMGSYVNEIVLQKCCEEINRKLGYYFMCIVKEDFFQNQHDKIKEHLNDTKHFSEADINIDPTKIFSLLEADANKETVCLLEDLMNKIVVEIDEEKSTFFTPQTIVSNLRRSNVKEKKKESDEVLVSRSSQNTLIVLTPECITSQSSEVAIPLKTTLSSTGLEASEKLITTSKDLQRSSNLLQVPVLGSSNLNLGGSELTNLKSDSADYQNIPPVEKDSSENKMLADPEEKLDDSEMESFKFNSSKKAASFRRYRVQGSDPCPVPKPTKSEGESVRIVRIRTSNNRSVQLSYEDEEEETPVYLTDRRVHIKDQGENSLIQEDPKLFNEKLSAPDDTLQGEDISDNEFSDEFLEVVSPGTETDAFRSRSRNRQHVHQKGMHSKYCRKRISKFAKESSTDKETALKTGRAIPTVSNFKDKHFSTFRKRDDEFSMASSTSNSSKRRYSPRYSRSPSLEEFLRKLSCSPDRKRSISPMKSYRKRGSPIRRRSRSPYRRRSRSPIRRRSRSPYKRHSRSPIKRRSRSPIRRRSRSPVRRRSRSPIRRRSRSPFKRRSRSPLRRRSRSPYRRNSRSPPRRSFRSPLKKRSRSPTLRDHIKPRERSPYRKIDVHKLFGPERTDLKIPIRRVSKSPVRRSKSPLKTYPYRRSPVRSDSRQSRDSQSYKLDSPYKYKKDSTIPLRSFENASKSSLSKRSLSEKKRDATDLDEISDEDESTYFHTSDNPVYLDIIKKLPESARIMLVKVLQRFSITNVNPNDPSFFELMKFVASHSTEIQRLMSQPSLLSDVPMQSNPMQSQESLVQQYLLSNMKGNLSASSGGFPSMSSTSTDIHFQQPGPSTSGLQFPSSGLQFHSSGSNLLPNQVPQAVFQPLRSQQQYPVQNIQQNTLPQLSPQQIFTNQPAAQLPPRFQPESFKSNSPQKPAMAPQQRKVQSEVMFKDLKARVSKIFGPEDVLGKIGIRIPGFNDKPIEKNWSPKPQDVLQPKNEPLTSFQDHRSGLNFNKVNEPPIRQSVNTPEHYLKDNEPYFEEATRDGPLVPPSDAKVAFCDVQRSSLQKNLFPVVGNSETMTNYGGGSSQISVNDAKKSLAQRLASVLVKVGMVDVPGHLLQEMLMKIGAFSMNPPQDINETEILGILRKLKYLS